MKFTPEIKVVRFGSEDVIATSGATRTLQNGDTLKFSGFGNDGNKNNNYLSLNDGSNIQVKSDADSINTVLTALGATGSELIVYPVSQQGSTLTHLFQMVDDTKTGWNDYTFEYNSSTSTFRAQ